MAYTLLGLKPWEWDELVERSTVAEVERVIAGAIWRHSIAIQDIAWQTALLMSAAGSKPRPEHELSMLPPSDDLWTVEKLIGRPRLPLDARQKEPAELERKPVDDGRPNWDEATRRDKAERAKLMFAMAQAAKASKGDGH